MSTFMLANEVARRLEVGYARVIQLADTGELPVAATTVRGWRLFDQADVERLAAERAAKATERSRQPAAVA